MSCDRCAALLSDLQAVKEENERLRNVGVVCGNGAVKELRDELAAEFEGFSDGQTVSFNLGFLRRIAEHRCASEGGLASAEARAQSAEQRAEKAEAALRRVKQMLLIPAAEYVPAITEAWDVIDEALR